MRNQIPPQQMFPGQGQGQGMGYMPTGNPMELLQMQQNQQMKQMLLNNNQNVPRR
jgi:predicted transcriptional regulator